MIAGAFAGLVGRIITAPIDFMKIRIQLNCYSSSSSLMESFRTVIKEEGFFSLWKGNLSATYLWISYAMVQFSTYGLFKKWIALHESPKISSVSSFIAGAGSGMTATLITYPLDIMRTQFVVQGKQKSFYSMKEFISYTYSKRGLKGR